MPKLKEIWAEFHTQKDEKDRGNGISELYITPSDGKVLGSNTSWGRELEFEEGHTDLGQRFDISSYDIDLKNTKTIRYRYDMDNDEGWKVSITIKGLADDNNTYVLGGDYRKIGNGRPRHGEISIGGHLGLLGGDSELGVLYRIQLIDEDENVLVQEAHPSFAQAVEALGRIETQMNALKVE